MTLGAALIVMTFLVAFVAGCDARSQIANEAPPPPEVDVAEVVADDVTLWNRFTGRVAAPETVALRPRVSGYIDHVAFTEGELVEQGQVLFVIDQRPYLARLHAAEADLAHARSRLALADSEAGRARQLMDARAISREEFDQRRAGQLSARATVEAAQAELEAAQLNLEYTEVRAPINGRAGRALVTQGNLATADSTLLAVVVSENPVHVYFESHQQAVPENAQLGDSTLVPVRVGFVDEEQFPHQGYLDFVDNQLNADTGTLQYRAVLDNTDGALRPGQFVRVEMPLHQPRHAVLIDQKAVLTDQDRRFVYILSEDDRAERRDVKTGRRVDGLLVIESGLSPGERVLVNGIQKVFYPGMEVLPQRVSMRRPAPMPEVAITP